MRSPVPTSGMMRAVAAEPLTAISPHCVPLRASARQPGKVDVALAVLSCRWLNGRELLAAIRAEALNILGHQADYDNANAVARNARAAAISRGLCWQYIWVNYEETGDGKDHRLWTVTHEMVARPHPSWQKGDAVVVMETARGTWEHSQAGTRLLVQRSEPELAERRAAVRGGQAAAPAGTGRHNPRGDRLTRGKSVLPAPAQERLGL